MFSCLTEDDNEWTNVNKSSMEFFDVHIIAVSYEI